MASTRITGPFTRCITSMDSAQAGGYSLSLSRSLHTNVRWGWMRRKRLKGYCPVLHSLSLIQPPSHSPSRFSLFCRVT